MRTPIKNFLTHKKQKEMIFKLLSERFLTFFDHIKILSKGNMKRNFVQKTEVPSLNWKYKKNMRVGKNILFYS